MNIDVVSFQRLAYRIFDELGKTNMAVLEETGKTLYCVRLPKSGWMIYVSCREI